MNSPQPLDLARAAGHALQEGHTRDATWYALWAVEADAQCGLAWAVLGRIVLDLNADPLATLGLAHALELGLPEDEAPHFAQLARIDLWTRGLLLHESQKALLSSGEFEKAEAFQETDSKAAWFSDRIEGWGSLEAAAAGLKRLVAALSDAWQLSDAEDPLKTDDGWQAMPAYSEFQKNQVPEAEQKPLPAPQDQFELLSDFWVERRIEALSHMGQLGAAFELAEKWLDLRPLRMTPRTAILRILAATGKQSELKEQAEALLELETEDLNELEAARVTLGELRQFPEQLVILERMAQLAPRHPVILANRGAVLLELERIDEAEADLSQALKVDPENGPALANMALLKMRKEEYFEARRILDNAVKLFPEQAQLWVYLAVCKNNRGDHHGAKADLEKALGLDPAHAEARMLLGQVKAN